MNTKCDKNVDLLINSLYEKGASLIAFSNMQGVKEAGGFKYAITIGYKLNDFVIAQITEKPTYEYFHHYRTVNTCLDQLALWCVTYLDRLGARSHMIPASQSSDSDPYAGAFPHKLAATLSGSGWIGKSSLFISKDFGSKIRLATVLTDYPLDAINAPMQSLCGECKLCVDACPAGAIVGKNYQLGQSRDDIFDAQKCSHFMKTAYQSIGRGSVCGRCIAVCPYNHVGLNKE